jgi:hypothetical protein
MNGEEPSTKDGLSAKPLTLTPLDGWFTYNIVKRLATSVARHGAQGRRNHSTTAIIEQDVLPPYGLSTFRRPGPANHRCRG